jgi:hypothetical protein
VFGGEGGMMVFLGFARCVQDGVHWLVEHLLPKSMLFQVEYAIEAIKVRFILFSYLGGDLCRKC